MDGHSLRSQVGVGSESDCLFGQLDRILWTSDSEAGVKTEKSGGVPGGQGECGDDIVGLLVRERWSLHILPVKKEAKLSASEVLGEVVGSGEEDLRCRSLLTVCQRRLGLSEIRRLKIQGWNSTLFGRQDELVVLVEERLERGPVSSRVSAFPDVFSMVEGGSKCTEGGRKPRV